MTDFAALGLPEDVLRAVLERGYTTPTPVQAQAIPIILDRRDIIAGAQTGTGKTAAFVLPLLARLGTQSTGPARRPPRALVLTPTRELAAQVEESVQHYGKYSRLRSLVMFGGVGINPQIDGLRRGIDILVATPGRLLDHMGQGTVDLSAVEILVLDEADRMLDMGFIRDIRRIIAVLPRVRQNLLFSATFPSEIKELAGSLMRDPAEVEIAPQGTTAERVTQQVIVCDRNRKKDVLVHLFQTRQWSQALIFTRTKHLANKLAEQLETQGIAAMAIHGNKSQTARTKALFEFKSGRLQALVATDIAARGIDISELPIVVNYELPMVAEDYVHRIGRTARAGASGAAFSLVCVDEYRLLESIERLTRQRFTRERVEGFEPDPNAKPQPIETGRGQRGGPRQGSGHGGAEPVRRSGPGNPRHASPGGSRSSAPGGSRSSSPGNSYRENPGNSRSENPGNEAPRARTSAVDGNRSPNPGNEAPRARAPGADGHRRPQGADQQRRPHGHDGQRRSGPGGNAPQRQRTP